MPRPRRDGAPALAANKRKLTQLFVSKVKPQTKPFLVWDTQQRGLALAVQRSGFKSWKAIYSFHGRPRWYHVGAADAVGLAAARKLVGRVMFQVAEGKDPAAERQAQRSSGTFEDVAKRYVEEYAKRNNKSWAQADALVRRHLLPRWGKLRAADVTRSDVRSMMVAITAPVTANQTLAAASAIFSWAIRNEVGDVKTNPCKLIDRNTTKARERVLAESELPLFWEAFDDAGLVRGAALKVILLTGQRPGEVSCMRAEHVVDGWWSLPGKPVPELGWPGTKNGEDHRVWLIDEVRNIVAHLPQGGLVFAGGRGRPISDLDGAMRDICEKLNVPRATPHDLRRTFSSMVTGLGYGRDAMNRVTNHKEGGIADVYDRHSYADENKQIMARIAGHVMALVRGGPPAAVINLGSARRGRA